MSTMSYLRIVKELLRTDFKVLKQVIPDKLINLFVWVTIMIVVNSYLLPSFGLSATYGSFILAGLSVGAGLFEVFPSVVSLVTDFEGDQTISYYLTLPMPTWLVWLRFIIYYAISYALLALLVLPLGQLLLWNQFSIVHVHGIKFGIIFLLTCLFYGALTLLMASFIKNMATIGNVWMRFLFPMWFLGCFQFSWAVLYKLSPAFAYANLLNPITYAMEGTRGAVLGPEGYLPFWLCVLMLALYILLFITWSIQRLKKRLDSL